jgi:hypothetical protein
MMIAMAMSAIALEIVVTLRHPRGGSVGVF